MSNDLYIKMYYAALNLQIQVEGMKLGLGNELDHKHLLQTACMDLYNLAEGIKDGE